MDAWTELGIYRLAARVNDLRGQGHKISTVKVSVRNKFGETCKVAQYSLE